jgi:hypothetical protein
MFVLSAFVFQVLDVSGASSSYTKACFVGDNPNTTVRRSAAA